KMKEANVSVFRKAAYMEEELRKAKQRNVELERSISLAEKTKDDAVKASQTFKEKTEEATKQSTEFQSKKDEIEKELQKILSEKEVMKIQVEMKQNELQYVNELNKTYQEKMTDYRNKTSELEDTISKQSKKLNSLERKAERLEKDLEEEKANNGETIYNLKEKIRAYEHDIVSLKSDVQMKDEKLETIAHDNKTQKEQKSEESVSVFEIQRECQTKIDELQKVMSQRENSAQEDQEKYRELMTKFVNISGENKKIKKEKETLEMERKEMMKEMNSKKEKLERAKKENDELKMEKRKLVEQLHSSPSPMIVFDKKVEETIQREIEKTKGNSVNDKVEKIDIKTEDIELPIASNTSLEDAMLSQTKSKLFELKFGRASDEETRRLRIEVDQMSMEKKEFNSLLADLRTKLKESQDEASKWKEIAVLKDVEQSKTVKQSDGGWFSSWWKSESDELNMMKKVVEESLKRNIELQTQLEALQKQFKGETKTVVIETH
ncbi:synaptonemal complex protein ZIP1, putative, partial [Entamoeba invadens IP1]|uniref:synaptonemal complex protein ZIP1, putative n=1 Tax=Entamoeba invadens IP1 TaxID=370355 RepID=UPI0002C3EB0B